jgi:hypothetical protein
MPARPVPSRRLARLALMPVLVLACGYDESNAIDLPRVEGVPVQLVHVRMAESRAAVLGSMPTTLSSGDAANAIGIAYDVRVVDAAPDHAGVSARLVCRLGEHAVASPLATDASNRLAAAAPGTVLEERTTFLPTPLSTGIPEVCETTLYYTIAPPLSSVPSPGDPPAPGPHLQPIGTVCFSGGELSQGACAADVLPRAPASTPVEVSRLVGRIGPLAGGGYGLGITVLVTAGEGVPAQFVVGGEATCETAGETKDVPLGLLVADRDLPPGESIVQSGATRPGDALPEAPAWCTVRMQLAQDGGKRTLAEFCVRGEETEEGACAP